MRSPCVHEGWWVKIVVCLASLYFAHHCQSGTYWTETPSTRDLVIERSESIRYYASLCDKILKCVIPKRIVNSHVKNSSTACYEYMYVEAEFITSYFAHDLALVYRYTGHNISMFVCVLFRIQTASCLIWTSCGSTEISSAKFLSLVREI